MRDWNYYREQREKHIKRKERIIKAYDTGYGPYWRVTHRGTLSKGKIHCSCGMCSRYRKTNNKAGRRLIHGNYAPSYNPSRRDIRRDAAMDSDEKENA